MILLITRIAKEPTYILNKCKFKNTRRYNSTLIKMLHMEMSVNMAVTNHTCPHTYSLIDYQVWCAKLIFTTYFFLSLLRLLKKCLVA